jgi:L-alanine-DL-glutamate epimerase-like enolase superfamily enzyme
MVTRERTRIWLRTGSSRNASRIAHRLSVAAHVGGRVQIHLQLSSAHAACNLLDFIPWLTDCFAEPATVKDGYFVMPQQPGAGTTLRVGALEKYGVAR